MKRSDSKSGRRPTIREVAAQAGVSHQTVSRVINSDGYVSEATRENVLEAIRRLNFVPNGIARSLSSRRSHTLGVVSNDISDHSFAEMAAGAELEARRHGFYLIIGSVEEIFDHPREEYTQRLLSAIPSLDPEHRKLDSIEPR